MPDDELPVELPDDVDFRPGGESPLARHDRFVKVQCPICGRDARRDTDTMDTFVDSSWYFFRYCSPGVENGPFRREDIDRWMPTDQYTGGVEHAILHLLYCRFFTKALYDMDMVAVPRAVPAADEPGSGDLRRRVDVQDEGEHRGADAADRAVGRRLDAAHDAVREPVRGRHRLEADRRRRRPPSGRAPLAGPRVRRGGRRGRGATARSRSSWCEPPTGRSRASPTTSSDSASTSRSRS